MSSLPPTDVLSSIIDASVVIDYLDHRASNFRDHRSKASHDLFALLLSLGRVSIAHATRLELMRGADKPPGYVKRMALLDALPTIEQGIADFKEAERLISLSKKHRTDQMIGSKRLGTIDLLVAAAATHDKRRLRHFVTSDKGFERIRSAFQTEAGNWLTIIDKG